MPMATLPNVEDRGPIGAIEPAFVVIPLSIQQEGAVYTVGSAERGEFYQFPEEAIEILRLLQRGEGVPSIKARLSIDGECPLDVDDFIDTLRQVGFIYEPGQGTQHAERFAAADHGGGFLFRANAGLARAIFSLPAFVLYLGLMAWAFAEMVLRPELRPSLSAFHFQSNLSVTLVALLLASSLAVGFHELAHMLAAARYGIASRVTISNRLWNIVAEADLTGILSLPRARRYLPLLAGMIADLLSVSVLTLVAKTVIDHGGGGFPLALIQALILQIIITIIWQFNFYLRTDVYYLICTYMSHPDLDRDVRSYLQTWFAQFDSVRGGRAGPPELESRSFAVKAYAVIWVLGRLLAMLTLVLVLVPTLYRYALDARRALTDPATPFATALDLTVFATLSIGMVVIGLAMWLRRPPISASPLGAAG